MFVVREETLIHSEGFCEGALDGIIHNAAGEGAWEFLLKKGIKYIEQTKDGQVTLVEHAYVYVLRVL